MSQHPQDKEIATWSPKERIEFERGLLRLLVAGRIENLMEHAELTQSELADRIGKSRAWVSKLLSGTQNATLDTLAEVAWALGVRWNPTLREAPREGTPAVDDPPLPHWVEAENQLTVRTAHWTPFSRQPASYTLLDWPPATDVVSVLYRSGREISTDPQSRFLAVWRLHGDEPKEAEITVRDIAEAHAP